MRLTLDEFNEKLSDANQTLFDGSFERFPGLFEIVSHDSKLIIHNELGQIGFYVKVGASEGSAFLLEARLEQNNQDTMCYDQKNKDVFDHIRKMFHD